MNNQSKDDIRDKIIGLGETSIRKSYYPQLKKRLDEIKELNLTLEDKVKERTEELNQKNLDLEKTLKELNRTQKTLIESEKMAALGTLVSGVAHEINTPIGISLTGITHFSDIAKKISDLYETNNLSENEFKEFLNSSKQLAKTISTNIAKAATLVDSFKQISVEHGTSEHRQFNLYNYIKDIKNALRGRIHINQHININIPENFNVFGSPNACYQIMTNLIINSLTHGFNNKDSGEIDIKAKKYDDKIIVTYKDNGKGIEKENLTKIFEPFFTTDRSFGGTGLGLNLVYNIITIQLNGTIICKSEVNKGVEFTITIPQTKK